MFYPESNATFNDMVWQCTAKQNYVWEYFKAMNTKIAYSCLMLQRNFQGITILSVKLIAKYKMQKTNFIKYIK